MALLAKLGVHGKTAIPIITEGILKYEKEGKNPENLYLTLGLMGKGAESALPFLFSLSQTLQEEDLFELGFTISLIIAEVGTTNQVLQEALENPNIKMQDFAYKIFENHKAAKSLREFYIR